MVFSQGHKTNVGKKYSEEHRRKMSEAAKGHILTEETKRKIGEAMKGHTVTEETRRKISMAHLKRFGLV
tara:strand:- start:7653 stop:7859 length:207 start_codon:yes stop_codon:yes gene_type:complete